MSRATLIESPGLDQGRLSLDNVGFSRLYRTTAQDLVVFFARRTYDAEAAADLMREPNQRQLPLVETFGEPGPRDGLRCVLSAPRAPQEWSHSRS